MKHRTINWAHDDSYKFDPQCLTCLEKGVQTAWSVKWDHEFHRNITPGAFEELCFKKLRATPIGGDEEAMSIAMRCCYDAFDELRDVETRPPHYEVKWTEDVRERLEAGETMEEIALSFGRRPSTIQRWLDEEKD